jgi:hypothetical protein
LFMTIGAYHITSTHGQPVEKGMIMVPEYGYETVLLRERMDYLKGFLREVSPVNQVPEIHHEINVPKRLPE